MHMADALVSPQVGGAMWAAAAGLGALAARAVRRSAADAGIPLMGALGAFVFAAQMVNFAIPGTGSSGHLGGGLLLAVMLGPHAAFLTIAAVLAIQALFFADGGLLALGCNLFNLGFFPCYVAFPLVYRPLAGGGASRGRLIAGAVAAGVAGLELGALGVVAQTAASGIASLPPGAFLLLMLPIHLAIGLVEGLATAALLLFVRRARPELLPAAAAPPGRGSFLPAAAAFAVAAVAVGGVVAWLASTSPDGLEWSILRAGGGAAQEHPASGIHAIFERVQAALSPLPDYGFAAPSDASAAAAQGWPRVDAGRSLSGVAGALLTLAVVAAAALVVRGRKGRGRGGD